jgi:SAM-dependent methyltransferase
MSGPPTIFDKKAQSLRRTRAKAFGDGFLAREAAEGLSERLAAVKRSFSEALALDVPDSAFAPLAPRAAQWQLSALDANEAIPLHDLRFDLVVSVLTLQSVNDLPGVLVQIRRILKPDGLLMAALFGGETLRELRDALAVGEMEASGGVSPRVSPFADVRELGGLLQRAGFALPVADSERTLVRYEKFKTLVSDLRALGETNALEARERKPLKRDVLAASLAHYTRHHAEPDGRLRATFDIVYLSGWAPHESQQKPLRPGTAKARFADALGVIEHSAGEKAKSR